MVNAFVQLVSLGTGHVDMVNVDRHVMTCSIVVCISGLLLYTPHVLKWSFYAETMFFYDHVMSKLF
jgi:hypothetical protein